MSAERAAGVSMSAAGAAGVSLVSMSAAGAAVSSLAALVGTISFIKSSTVAKRGAVSAAHLSTPDRKTAVNSLAVALRSMFLSSAVNLLAASMARRSISARHSSRVSLCFNPSHSSAKVFADGSHPPGSMDAIKLNLMPAEVSARMSGTSGAKMEAGTRAARASACACALFIVSSAAVAMSGTK